MPSCRLKYVIPPKIIESDKKGIENIFLKSQELKKLEDWKESIKQGRRLKARLGTINRHNDLKQLERRCGIEKVRDRSLPEGPFGYMKEHKVSKRTEELSKPKTARKSTRFDHEDFRGLLHADFTQALSKINHPIISKNESFKINSKSQQKRQQSITDIDNFDMKMKKTNELSNSNIEVTSYDLVNEFFS